MKLTNNEILMSYRALDSLGNKEFPITLTYLIIDNLEKLGKECDIYFKTLKKAKSEKDKQELLQIEKEVDLEKIDKNELIEAGITLTPIQLVGLKRLIDG